MTVNLRRRAGRAATAALGAALAIGMIPGLAAGSASAAGSVTAPGALSGTITDGSGHDWPLYAKVEAGGKSTFTDPVTGAYTLPIIEPGSYDVTVTAQATGYRSASRSVQVGADGATHDVALTVDTTSCSAAGYSLLTETFDTGQTPQGWSVVDHQGGGHRWEFADRHERGNKTGGDGGFAIFDSWGWGRGDQDTSLVSPSFSLVGVANPVVTFKTDLWHSVGSEATEVDVSIDGGKTWISAWRNWFSSFRGPRTMSVSLAKAAGQADVKVRWHYYRGSSAWWWQVDDIAVRSAACTPVDGSLLVGQVDDAVTGKGLAGARVSLEGGLQRRLTAQPTPADEGLDDGYFSAFVPGAAAVTATATKDEYVADTVQIDPTPGQVTPVELALDAGRLEVTSSGLAPKVDMGATGKGVLRVANTGTAPATISLAARDAGSGVLAPDNNTSTRTPTPSPLAPASTPQAAWTAVPDYPTRIKDNAAGMYEGRIYSFGGFDTYGTTAASFRYDPQARAWEPIAAMPGERQNMAGAFLDGKFHVVGGWSDNTKTMEPSTLVYDPETDTWDRGPEVPVTRAAAGTAVMAGKIYLVGGCDTESCGHTEVFSYDPVFEEFERLADYPEPTSYLACGGFRGTVVCAGGKNAAGEASRSVYSYDPIHDEWTPMAQLPRHIWGANATSANGSLLISGGFSNGPITRDGWRYDPTEDEWYSLPAAGAPRAQGGAACGMYRIGGTSGYDHPSSQVEVLEGYDDCVDTSPALSWLDLEQETATIAPGESVSVGVSLGSSGVDQPGRYLARVGIKEDTPYDLSPLAVSMDVPAPRSWAAISGTVRGQSCDGTVAPLDRVTVSVKTASGRWTTVTRRDGEYLRWLSRDEGPFQVVVGRNGYTPQVRDIKLQKRSTVEDVTLVATGC
ncbi:kelch repeat-containing protein [Nocardioides albus]|uniref:Galactose oxidase n=1 Tax=Nocardioides albus TaxID=1841 RepID=A0A7W5A8G1_9ACTN|nr:kelch repeat-containing protein [Nocardioides albus]MBB3091109.1 hypothetical protein [Nocardioides albus]GGU34282.1 hypothetical protein GCM10007979_36760 [Nocardioides albus]